MLGAVVAAGCGDGERSTAPTVTPSTRPPPASLLSPSATLGCDLAATPSEADRIRAMVVVQTLVVTWDPVLTHGDASLVPPPAPVLDGALELIRCDVGARAVSRHGRAVARILGNDWDLVRAAPALRRLGFADADTIAAFKARVVAAYSHPVFALHAHDPRWVEFAILRHLTTTEHPPGRVASIWPGLPFGPALAHAETPPSCWQPEAPSTFTYVRPYVELTAHVSVEIDPALTESAAKERVQAHVDPQEWNACGRFWSPPDPANAGGTLDGARFVMPQWTSGGPCVNPAEPFQEDPTAPDPGLPYATPHYLFEHFFLPGSAPAAAGPLDAWFKNVLGTLAATTVRRTRDGTVTPTHRIDYWLGTCAVDKVKGAMDGQVFGNPLTTILDSGDIQVWTEGTRTHVAATKTFEFDDPGATWLTRLNPALRELNDQLGELACCL
jgi:hypothetical protein